MGKVFITGVTGFIGKRLLAELLGRGERVVCLVRPQSVYKIDGIIDSLKADVPDVDKRVTIAEGDIALAGLGLDPGLYEKLCAEVTEIYHSAAVYDLGMSEEDSARINTGGTRNVLDFAGSVRSLERLHHISTIAVAGDYEGVWSEADFDKGQRFLDFYGSSKFDSEKLVRERMDEIPTTIYRPGAVIGDSRTGEMDKIDGPYFFFKMIQWRAHPVLPCPRDALINIVPIDYVVAAMVHIGGLSESRGLTFSLTDPSPMTYSNFFDLACRSFGTFKPFVKVPPGWVQSLISIPGVKWFSNRVSRAIDIPLESIPYMGRWVYYDTANARKFLEGSGIACPPILSYIDRIIDYFREEMAD